jgi:hypothetical protein
MEPQDNQGRGRFILAECVSIYVVALWFVLISWAGLLVWSLVSRSRYPIPDVASAATTLEWTLSRLQGASLILVFASVFAVFFAVLVRSGLGAVLGGVVTLTVLNIATRSSAAEKLSPAAWVASLMDFQRHQYLIDHVWAERSIAVSASSSVLWLVVSCAVLSAAAVILMNERDVLT